MRNTRLGYSFSLKNLFKTHGKLKNEKPFKCLGFLSSDSERQHSDGLTRDYYSIFVQAFIAAVSQSHMAKQVFALKNI